MRRSDVQALAGRRAEDGAEHFQNVMSKQLGEDCFNHAICSDNPFDDACPQRSRDRILGLNCILLEQKAVDDCATECFPVGGGPD